MRIGVVYVGLISLNLLGWAWAVAAFGQRPVLLGVALLAYSFGLRHAFDADHIAAIDNVVRRLVHEKREPHGVGAYFAFGHSTVVVLASLAIALTATRVRDQLEQFHLIGGVVGAIVSAAFLLTLGLVNLLVLADVWSAFNRVRAGGVDANADFHGRHPGGLMTLLLRRTFALVSRPWHMYAVGFLFGLSFDTATEIGVLGISAAQATQGGSIWTILIFPLLFAAGMSLMDYTDSVLMTGAYGWASGNPIRKVWYNLTITATSVIVALLIGSLEALSLIVDKLHLSGGIWRLVRWLNGQLGLLGFGIVGVFAAAWLVSFAIFHLRGYGDARAFSPTGEASV